MSQYIDSYLEKEITVIMIICTGVLYSIQDCMNEPKFS